jgi:hypothetical protein
MLRVLTSHVKRGARQRLVTPNLELEDKRSCPLIYRLTARGSWCGSPLVLVHSHSARQNTTETFLIECSSSCVL